MAICYTCQAEITFDKSIVSKSGKQIPLWMDKLNAHGHDEEGRPIRQPLPAGRSFTPESSASKLNRMTTVTAGGETLDTKRLLQAVMENTKAIQELQRIIDSRTVLDTNKYEQRTNQIYNVIAPILNKETFKTAADRQDIMDTALIDHSKRADENIARKSASSRKEITDADIPDSDEFENMKKIHADIPDDFDDNNDKEIETED